MTVLMVSFDLRCASISLDCRAVPGGTTLGLAEGILQ